MKVYILRLENKAYVGLVKHGSNATKVLETDIHHAFPFKDEKIAFKYAEALNNNERIDERRMISDLKVIELAELTITTKVTARQKI